MKLTMFLGHELLTAGGAQWARNRRLLTPAFHFDVLKPYIDIYNDCAEKLIVRNTKVSEVILYHFAKPFYGDILMCVQI